MTGGMRLYFTDMNHSGLIDNLAC